jgi:hypothetical protein
MQQVQQTSHLMLRKTTNNATSPTNKSLDVKELYLRG